MIIINLVLEMDSRHVCIRTKCTYSEEEIKTILSLMIYGFSIFLHTSGKKLNITSRELFLLKEAAILVKYTKISWLFLEVCMK
jgi:hypothetical protein